jgi:succinoglycan biosynthesis transport protein ExoP
LKGAVVNNSLANLPKSSSSELIELMDGEQSAEIKPKSPLLVIHTLLHGRYRLAIGLAFAGLILGSLLGYVIHHPTYRSWGMIRIRPYMPKILYPTEQNDVLPMYDGYMDSQVALIHIPKLIDLAMQDPRWKELNRGQSADEIESFTENLEVTRTGELITIAFTDTDAVAATRAVNSVIDAFQKRFADSDLENQASRMVTLQHHKADLETEMNRYEQNIATASAQYGTSATQKLYDLKLEELSKAQSQLRLAELALAAGEARMKGQVDGTNPTTVPIMPEDVANSEDSVIKQYMLQKDTEELRIRRLSLHLGENHPQVVEARAYVAQLDAMIGSLSADTYNWPGAQNSQTLTGSLDSLRERAARARDMYDKINAETQSFGQKSVELEKLRKDSDVVRAELDETTSRIEKLKLEDTSGDRIAVATYGEVPHQPYKTHRGQVSAACGIGFAALGFGSVVLMGFFDPRLRHITDAQSRLPKMGRVLGVLPSLEDDSADVGQSALAAHCVHRIRTMLQISQVNNNHRVLAITSPSPGDGKTSLTVALGMSFAATGAKTLLIDSDMQGGGLTARMSASSARRLGQILIRNQLISQQQLQQALNFGQTAGKRLGEVLVEWKYLNAETIEQALLTQGHLKGGLFGAVRGEPLKECILSTNIPNLHVLPLGSKEERLVAQLSPATIRPILDEAAKNFDIVLIDTGPLLGSLEAALVSSEADGVVLTISRGGQRTLAQNAINYLLSMDAELEGIVFNRARPIDIEQSGYSASVSSRSVNRDVPGSSSRIGPVAGAMRAEK